MSEKASVNVSKKIWKDWDEMMLCVSLIRQGKAKIMIATRRDGSKYRYTKLK